MGDVGVWVLVGLTVIVGSGVPVGFGSPSHAAAATIRRTSSPPMMSKLKAASRCLNTLPL